MKRDTNARGTDGLDSYDAYSVLSLAAGMMASRTVPPVGPINMVLARQMPEQSG